MVRPLLQDADAAGDQNENIQWFAEIIGYRRREDIRQNGQTLWHGGVGCIKTSGASRKRNPQISPANLLHILRSFGLVRTVWHALRIGLVTIEGRKEPKERTSPAHTNIDVGTNANATA